jgi:hypothetical protein
MTLADDVDDGVYLACVVDELLAPNTHTHPGLAAARVQLLRVSERSGVETHTHPAVSHVRAWRPGVVMQGCMQRAHTAIIFILYSLMFLQEHVLH